MGNAPQIKKKLNQNYLTLRLYVLNEKNFHFMSIFFSTFIVEIYS